MPSNVAGAEGSVSTDSPNLDCHFPASFPYRTSSHTFFKEEERLRTYDDWPVTFLSPETMAKAGFYYTKRRDIVRCPFCDVEVMNWERGDIPWDDHRKWKPTCRFILDESNCGNIPLDGPPTSIHNNLSHRAFSPPSPNDSGYDTCGPHEIRGVDIPNTSEFTSNSAVHKTKTPSFPQYGSLEARQESFSSWPVSLKVKPNALSEAGFYYTGKGDQTICFYCGGGLKDWEDTDDPWTEHARWFSKCTFVILTKGEKFIESAKSGLDMSEPSIGVKGCQPDSENVTLKVNGEVNKPSCSTSVKTETNDRMLCKLCYSKGLEVAFLPCGHLMSCVDCSLKLKTCGVCRQPITGVVRTFIP